MSFAPEDLTLDAFLGGRLQLLQPKAGYRAGVDPVLLAASVHAQPTESVLDLGCGAGAGALCLATRVPRLRLAGLERHAGYADLARRNGAALGLEVFEGDVAAPPSALRQMSFDHVIANPPYFERVAGTPAPDPNREAALGEDTPLAVWIETATKRLKPRGMLHLILKADRLADCLAGLTRPLGSIEVCPIAPREGRPARLILVKARKDGRALLKLHAAVVLHAEAEHIKDGVDYTPEISRVLRDGSALF